jgi:hypothetical protein
MMVSPLISDKNQKIDNYLADLANYHGPPNENADMSRYHVA